MFIYILENAILVNKNSRQNDRVIVALEFINDMQVAFYYTYIFRNYSINIIYYRELGRESRFKIR